MQDALNELIKDKLSLKTQASQLKYKLMSLSNADNSRLPSLLKTLTGKDYNDYIK
jgi:hypothetical protein